MLPHLRYELNYADYSHVALKLSGPVIYFISSLLLYISAVSFPAVVRNSCQKSLLHTYYVYAPPWSHTTELEQSTNTRTLHLQNGLYS